MFLRILYAQKSYYALYFYPDITGRKKGMSRSTEMYSYSLLDKGKRQQIND